MPSLLPFFSTLPPKTEDPRIPLAASALAGSLSGIFHDDGQVPRHVIPKEPVSERGEADWGDRKPYPAQPPLIGSLSMKLRVSLQMSLNHILQIPNHIIKLNCVLFLCATG